MIRYIESLNKAVEARRLADDLKKRGARRDVFCEKFRYAAEKELESLAFRGPLSAIDDATKGDHLLRAIEDYLNADMVEDALSLFRLVPESCRVGPVSDRMRALL